MGLKSALFLILIFSSCSQEKNDKKAFSVSVEAILSRNQILKEVANFPINSDYDDSSKSYLRLNISNNLGRPVQVKCIKVDSFYIYEPIRIQHNHGVAGYEEFIDIIDCFNCSFDLILQPNESKSVYSDIPKFNKKIKKIDLYFSYFRGNEKRFLKPIEVKNPNL